MADNRTRGSSGEIDGTDEIGGVDYARVKIIVGADGVNDGDVSSTNPIPTTPNDSNTISTSSFNSRDAATFAAAATFQGVGEDVSAYGRAGISIKSDNATDGTLTIETSHDNVIWGGPTRTWANTSIAQPHM